MTDILTKMANGVEVVLSAEETAAIFAERAEWAARKVALANAPPISVPNFKLRIALRRAGMGGVITDYVATLDPDARDAWEYSTDVGYDSPFVVAACVALKISDEQKAAIYKLAASL